MKQQLKKKIFALWISAIILISMLPAIYALTREVCVLEIESVAVNAGEIVRVPVGIKGNPGFSSFEMTVTVPESLICMEAESDLLGDTLTFNPTNGFLAYAGDQNIDADGTLFWLHLEASKQSVPRDYKISVEVREITSDAAHSGIDFSEQFGTAEGVVTVTTDVIPSLAIGTVQVNAGGSAKVPVYIKNNPGFSSFDMMVTIPDGFTCTEAKSDLLADTLTFNTDKGLLAYAGSQNIDGDGMLFWLFLEASDQAGVRDYEINISVIEMTNDAAHGSVDFGKMFETAAGMVTVTTETLYTITVEQPDPKQGSLVVDPSGSVTEGTNVKITATPASGYKLTKIIVTDSKGKETVLTGVDEIAAYFK